MNPALVINTSLPQLEFSQLLPELPYVLMLADLAILSPLPLLIIPVFPAVLTDDFLTSNSEILTSDGEALQW